MKTGKNRRSDRHGAYLAVYLGLMALAVVVGTVRAEHVPADWNDMELHKWYDMVPLAEPVSEIVTDPLIPGRLYGLREKDDGSWMPVTSSDDGQTWQAFDDGIRTPINSITCHHLHVVQSGADQRRLFVIGDELEFDYYQRTQVMYSRQDLTSPWTECVVGTTDTRLIGVSAHSSGTVLLSTEASPGDVFLAKIRRSTDWGSTWQTVYSNPMGNYYNDMRFSPFDDGTVYACGWCYDETQLIKSSDWGQTWQTTNFPYDTTPLPRHIFYHPDLPDAVFVTLEERFHSIPYCIKVSWDGGDTWQNYGPRYDEKEMKLCCVFFDPLDSSTVIISGAWSHIWKSTDAGTDAGKTG
ncbi:hypothetical protein JXA80_13950 [bacterium]|nr:hypothetical protein [candidate division CSSED10-310 bacterium]